MEEPFTVQARCGADLGNVSVHCCAENTVDEVIDRMLRSQGASTSTPDVSVTYRGRPCGAQSTLSDLGAGSGSRLDVVLRLRGGGGDGGATGAESRISYLEMYASKKPDKVNPEEAKLAQWTTCRLSGDRLSRPVCTDELGFLYNKSSVVAGLVAKSLPPKLAHITSLKHLIELKLEDNKDEAKKANGATAGDFQLANGADFACPLTGLPMNGRYRFSVLRSTGHVLSEKALKEIPSAVEDVVGSKWAHEDVMPLNGTPAEVQELRERVMQQRAAIKASKDKKKGAKISAAAVEAAIASAAVETKGSKATAYGAHEATNGVVTDKKRAAAHSQLVDVRAQAKKFTGVASDKKRAAADLQLVDEKAQAKKFKATELAPSKATKAVWSSIFLSSRPEEKETYGCRALSSRGWA